MPRVAAHKVNKRQFRGKGLGGTGPVLASVTFHEKAAAADGFLRVTDELIEFQTATAIGVYMIRSRRVEDIAVPVVALAAE